MPYCIYLRKSRKDMELEQFGEGETLARHKRILLELARKQNLTIGEIYEEIVSGESIEARPQMQRLLRDVENNLWDGVLVMELERLARGDTRDQGTVAQTFKLTDTLIITPQKTYNPLNEFDEEYFEFGLFMSRREYKTINRRLQAGRLASVKEGNYIGSTPPFGYDKVRQTTAKGYTLAENEESDYVRMIYDLYVNKNMTPGKIADHLTSIGIQPKKGGNFTMHSVRDILRNPIYIGKVRWNWRPNKKSVKDGKVIVTRPRNANESTVLINGKHPAIISEELFNAAQQKHGGNPRTQVNHELINPFAHLMYCRECGKAMIYRAYRNGAPRLICANKYCEVSSSPFDVIEQSVIDSLKEKLGELEIAASQRESGLNSDFDAYKAALRKIEQELEQANRQQNRLYDLLEQGIYTQETFLERQKLLDQRKKELQNKLVSARENAPREINYDKCITRVRQILELYDTLSAEDKNSILRGAIKKITYYRPKSDRYHQSPASVEIELIFE
ncbi:recombinase family protein [Ruminococcus sp. Marseille-P6503]|uniref:recombinase family protein n=1 Tax=Ruminococcus sp. Marseille-P6503 TaxID=2364796 RepID=UPI000F54C0B1|nr:recombinase family protein [Ruminococcus sp. Marseille-P6503]